jgi:hypothetical protein
MSDSSRSPDEEVLRVRQEQEKDHARMDEITLRLRQASDLVSLAAALDELSTELEEHFAQEERPQGIFALLGTRAPAQRVQFESLLDEHADLLERARSLVERARVGGADEERIGQDTGRLLRLIREHEHRENAAADDVLRQGMKRPKS